MATAAFSHDWRDQEASSVGDLRPILPRTLDNAWERTERLRTELHSTLERLCQERRIRALVLQSPSYVSPAWVKFESWSPRGEPCLTARTAFTIQLHTLPHHHFETLYTVQWERYGTRRSVAQLHALDETHLRELLDMQMEPDAQGSVHRRVRRLLRPLQIRQQWWQVLRPRNRVTAVRRDWLTTGSVVAILLGLWLFVAAAGEEPSGLGFAGLGGSTAGFGGESAPGPPASPAATMSGLAFSYLVPVDASGDATLEPSDAAFEDARHYDARSLELTRAQQVVVTMRSSAFDTYLVIGRVGADGFEPVAVNDDGGDDGMNSRLSVDLDPGEYVLLFTTYGPQQVGPYSYTVDAY